MAPTPVLVLHVSGGTIGLLSGAVSLTFRKGSRPHRVAGTVFFISMLVAAAAGTYLGYRNTEMDNVFDGVLVLYLLLIYKNAGTAKRSTSHTRSHELCVGWWVENSTDEAPALFRSGSRRRKAIHSSHWRCSPLRENSSEPNRGEGESQCNAEVWQ